jgi:hypothetical protein
MDESSTEYESESESESESIESEIIYSENESDNVYEFEEQFQTEQSHVEIDKKYFIGCYKYIPEENINLFVNKIHLSTFMKFSGKTISKYLFWHSGIAMLKYPSIEILQLIVKNDTYIAVVKTFYIKIIQRAWKKIYKQRKIYLFHRMKLKSIFNYEIGKRSYNYAFPGLKGLLL